MRNPTPGSFKRFARRYVCPLTATMAFWAVSTAVAEDASYILRDGRRVPVTRSTSELGLVLRHGVDQAGCAQRLAADGCGVVEDIAGAVDSPVKLLRVADATAARRIQILRDADVSEVRPVYRFAGSPSPMIGTGEINVRVRKDMDDDAVDALWSDHDVVVLAEFDGITGVYRVKPRNPGHDEMLRAENLAGDSRVVWAQPNLRRASAKRQVGAQDTYFPLQWHLNNTGQAGGTADADIDAPEAWLIAEGQGILIGMFDDACDVDHEDLREGFTGTGHDPSLESNDDGFDDPRPKQIGDQHGTAVMGLAVARANTIGVRGVAYLSRFTASRGLGGILTDFDRASVFTFARQQNVDVHLNSWGNLPGEPNSAVVEDAIRVAYRQGRPVAQSDNGPEVPGEDEEEPPPARGMVIVWASGNEGIQILPGFDYSMLPEVIGVGATSSADLVAGYSNFGTNINVVAPGGETLSDSLTTTDNQDRPGIPDNGYNVDGSQLDGEGRYTDTFVGTSAACPITAGVAALILSVNEELTANDVRLILEHTADRVSESDAAYNRITSRSIRYGYGRINANRAVTAAQQTLTNGGFTWPERPFNVRISQDRLRWQTSVGTTEFLVIEADSLFEFAAADGLCYDQRQIGCGSAQLTPLPSGVRVNSVISCARGCEFESDQSISVENSQQRFHAIFGRNSLGRYAFGVLIDPSGVVTDAGPDIGTAVDDGGGTDGGGQAEAPRVTISASPLEGPSPLSVQFMGNAVSIRPIDESATSWDFDVDTPPAENASTRNATWTYTNDGSEPRTFVARLTMYDVDGRVPGTASVMIRVLGSGEDDGGTPTESDLRIVVGTPGSPDSDVPGGVSPFSVELSIDAQTLSGSLQSILWDLGDGNTARSLIVPHTYINTTSADLVIPITATVNTRTTGGAVLTSSATRIITVKPGIDDGGSIGNDNVCFASPEICNDNSSGGGSSCFPMGMLPMGAMFLGLFLFRGRIR